MTSRSSRSSFSNLQHPKPCSSRREAPRELAEVRESPEGCGHACGHGSTPYRPRGSRRPVGGALRRGRQRNTACTLSHSPCILRPTLLFLFLSAGSVLARAASAVSRMLRAGSSLPGPPERGGSAVVGFSCVQDLKQQCHTLLRYVQAVATASDPPNRRILGAMQGFLSPRFEIGSAGQCQQARSHARGQPMSEADCDYVLLTSRHHFPDAMVSSRSLGHDFLSLPPNACPQLQSCGGWMTEGRHT